MWFPIQCDDEIFFAFQLCKLHRSKEILMILKTTEPGRKESVYHPNFELTNLDNPSWIYEQQARLANLALRLVYFFRHKILYECLPFRMSFFK